MRKQNSLHVTLPRIDLAGQRRMNTDLQRQENPLQDKLERAASSIAQDPQETRPSRPVQHARSTAPRDRGNRRDTFKRHAINVLLVGTRRKRNHAVRFRSGYVDGSSSSSSSTLTLVTVLTQGGRGAGLPPIATLPALATSVISTAAPHGLAAIAGAHDEARLIPVAKRVGSDVPGEGKAPPL